jgi:regulator of replication initiation timing
MINFFKHKQKASIAEDVDLTTLDIPDLVGVPSLKTPYYQTSINHKQQIGQQSPHPAHFIPNAPHNPSPTRSEFKNMKIVQSGLDGERQRNIILEEQIKMLSYQASMALDKLSELCKENESLKVENNKLKKHSRQLSTASMSAASDLSGQDSVFSEGKQMMSQASSMQSLKSHLIRSSAHMDELSQSYQKELNTMRLQMQEMTDELKGNDATILGLQNEIAVLLQELQQQKKDNKRLWHKLILRKTKHDVELELYQTQLDALMEQLQLRQEADLQLRQRLMDYDENKFTLMSSRKLTV